MNGAGAASDGPGTAARADEPTRRIAVPRIAATVVLLRESGGSLEVLLTRRPPTMTFAADVDVFPGGAIDRDDAAERLAAASVVSGDEAARRLGGGIDGPAALAAHVAAVRELFEESGVLLAEPPPPPARASEMRSRLLARSSAFSEVVVELGLTLRTDRLAPLSRWVTPSVYPRRFDARFFAAALPPGAAPSFDPGEVSGHRWITPAAALRAMAAGEIALWLPTSTTLQQLEHVRSFDEIVGRLAPGLRADPHVQEITAGIVRIVVPAAGGVPGQAANTYLVGTADVVVVDPGDPDEAVHDLLLATAGRRGGAIRGIVLTHADPDHAAGAQALADRCRVPVLGGPGAGGDVPFPIEPLRYGDLIGAGDVPLRVVPTPGHRPDHVALLVGETPGGRPLALVGDLLGPPPSRAVTAPPDVPAWLDSLARLDARRPALGLPGHGDPIPDPADAIRARRTELLAGLLGR